jgi:hypothetical protein
MITALLVSGQEKGGAKIEVKWAHPFSVLAEMRVGEYTPEWSLKPLHEVFEDFENGEARIHRGDLFLRFAPPFEGVEIFVKVASMPMYGDVVVAVPLNADLSPVEGIEDLWGRNLMTRNLRVIGTWRGFKFLMIQEGLAGAPLRGVEIYRPLVDLRLHGDIKQRGRWRLTQMGLILQKVPFFPMAFVKKDRGLYIPVIPTIDADPDLWLFGSARAGWKTVGRVANGVLQMKTKNQIRRR